MDVLGEQPACCLIAKTYADKPPYTTIHWEWHFTTVFPLPALLLLYASENRDYVFPQLLPFQPIADWRVGGPFVLPDGCQMASSRSYCSGDQWWALSLENSASPIRAKNQWHCLFTMWLAVSNHSRSQLQTKTGNSLFSSHTEPVWAEESGERELQT